MKYLLQQITPALIPQSWASDHFTWGDQGIPVRVGSHSGRITVAATSPTNGTFDLYVGFNKDGDIQEWLDIPADGISRDFGFTCETNDPVIWLLVEQRGPSSDVTCTKCNIEIESA